MRIAKLLLRNFGVFESLEIDFKKNEVSNKAEIHIFTGSNGSGKSTILYALSSVFLTPENLSIESEMYGRNGRNGRNRMNDDFSYITKRFKNTNSSNSFIEVLFDKEVLMKVIATDELNTSDNENSEILEHKLIEIYNKDTRYKDENLIKYYSNYEYIENPLYIYNQKLSNKKISSKFNFIVAAYSGNRSIQHYSISGIEAINEPPMESSLSFKDSINNELIIKWIANTITERALAENEKKFDEAKKYDNAIKRIEKVVSDLTGYSVFFSLERNPLNVTVNINKEKLDFDVLPEGLKSIISWIADLLMRMERIQWQSDIDVFDRILILFLDEIDIHLHPKWQRKVLPIIQNLFKNAQIFVSTHSPFVVGSVDDAFVYKLQVNDSVSTLQEITDSKAGNSIEYILEDIFQISEQFDVETEEDIKYFNEIKSKIISHQDYNREEFISLIKKLKQKSAELKDIISLELIQIKHFIGEDFINV